MRTPSNAVLKQIAAGLDLESLAKLAAHVVLQQQVDFCKEFGNDEGNDAESRVNCLKALTDADELFSVASDMVYQQLVEEFFDGVSNEMVKIAKDYV